MNCLNRIELQSYFDNELDVTISRNIKSHIESCEICSNMYVELKDDIHNTVDSISEIEVPSFEIPTIDSLVKTQKSTDRTYRLTNFVKIAAAIVFIIVSLTVVNNYFKQSEKTIENELLNYELANESDPNTQWHNNEFVVTLSGTNGEVILSVVLDNSN